MNAACEPRIAFECDDARRRLDEVERELSGQPVMRDETPDPCHGTVVPHRMKADSRAHRSRRRIDGVRGVCVESAA